MIAKLQSWCRAAVWYFPEKDAGDIPPEPEARMRESFAYIYGVLFGLASGGLFALMHMPWWLYVAFGMGSVVLITYRMMVQAVREERYRDKSESA